jgi:hypothetical protein
MLEPPDERKGPRRRPADASPNRNNTLYLSTHPVRAAQYDAEKISKRSVTAVVGALARDPWLPVHDRTLAVAVGHRARLGLPIGDTDVRRLRSIYARRRGDVAALLRMYHQ